MASRSLSYSLNLLCLWACAAFAGAAAAAELPNFTRLVEQNGPAVVNIGTRTRAMRPDGPEPDRRQMPDTPDIPEDSPLYEFLRRFFGDQLPEIPSVPGEGVPRSSLGSGFIVSADGYVITNYHVVRGADEVIVRLSDRREFDARLIGSDERSDLAVLKIEADGRLPVLKLGRADRLKVGEWVLAIGSPFGFEHSATAGIVSAMRRYLPDENYVPFIQTDVAINPGNSGGPLFNLDGEVVGVNSQIFSRTGGFMGLSFAIPIEVVMDVYQQIRDKGSVTRGWLGVLIQDVTSDLAESFGLDKPRGALVSRVMDDSPAAGAGIEPGDIIVRFDGREVDTSSALPPMVGSTPLGKRVPVVVLREGRERTLQLTIAELPASETLAEATSRGAPGETQRLGMTVREITQQERDALGLDGEGGIVVVDASSGPAFDAGVRQGDVILQFDNKPVTGLARFRELVDAVPPGRSVPVLVQRREGGPLFLAIKVPGQ